MSDHLAVAIDNLECQIVDRMVEGIKEELKKAGQHIGQKDCEKLADLLTGRVLLTVVIS